MKTHWILMATLLAPAASQSAEHPIKPGDSPQAVLDRAAPGDRLVFLPGLHQHRLGKHRALLYVDKSVEIELRAGATLKLADGETTLDKTPEITNDHGASMKLGDLTVGGEYDHSLATKDRSPEVFPGNTVYTLVIDGEGKAGQPDTFAWGVGKLFDKRKERVPITGDWQALNAGVKVRFEHRTGHNTGSLWFISYDGRESYGIRIGHGLQPGAIKNVRIFGKGTIDLNASHNVQPSGLVKDISACVLVHGRVRNVTIEDITMTDTMRSVMVYGEHTGKFLAGGGVTPGESFDAENISILRTRTINPNGSGYLLGHPSHRGRLRNVRCNFNYMETATTAIEPNFQLDDYEVIGNVIKSGGQAIHCWRMSSNGVIADNLRIHDNTGKPVVVANAPGGWKPPFNLTLRNNRNHLSDAALAGDLTVVESGKSPDKKITVTSPGIYKAVIWQASGGGGLAEFYDLAADPDAKFNLAGTAGTTKGLMEVGWHGRGFKSAAEKVEKRTCCAAHVLDPKRPVTEACYDGTMEWPSTAHNKFKVAGETAAIEKSAARVRIQGTGTFTWWSKLSNQKDAAVTATYTFYPAGQILFQFRVRMIGKERTLHWSREYGPHLLVAANVKDPQKDAGFSFNTVTLTNGKGEEAPAKSEQLVLATSAKVKATLMLTILAEANALFDRHMHHNGRGIGWDRFGYGSTEHDMPPGYDKTWACLVQLGTQDHKLLPPLRTAKDALPFAMQYRTPAKIEGAELVKDDAGDFNKDGFNESEGCHVLKGAGPLAFTYERGTDAGFAPAFKVIGWKGASPRTAKVDGKDVPAIAAVVDGNLIVQVLGTIPDAKAKVEIGP